MEIAIVILTVSTLLLGYTSYNLLRKLEKYEDVIDQLEKGLESLNLTIIGNLEHIRSLDANGHFESDDELGTFFKAMTDSSETIATTFYNIQNKDAQEEE